MIHLVLDTAIYRGIPRLDSPEFKLLSYMVERGYLVLHVPHIVEREQSTELEQVQRGRLKKAINVLTNALSFEEHGPKSKDLNSSLEELRANLDYLVEERSAAFTYWLDKYNAVHHQITLDQTQRALEAYFKGLPPLKQPKVRKDIPDSFIFQQILDLKNTYQSQLGIVVEDNGLRSACVGAGIACWVSLHEFITSPAAQKFLAQTVIKENKDEILSFVRSLLNEKIDNISAAVETTLLSNDYSLLSGDSIPGENKEIYLSGVNTPYEVEVVEIEYLGDTVFLAYVQAQVELQYQFPMFKIDVLALDVDKYHFSPLNDHYFEVETTDVFQFSGRIELDFPQETVESASVDEMKTVLQNPMIRVSDLEDFEVVNSENP